MRAKQLDQLDLGPALSAAPMSVISAGLRDVDRQSTT